MYRIYDREEMIYIDMPESMKAFLDEINLVCKKHNLSISHEDTYGSFIIEEYDKDSIDWLFHADKCY